MTDARLSTCAKCGNRFDPVLRDSCPLCSAGAATEDGALQFEEPSQRAARTMSTTDGPPETVAAPRRIPLAAITVMAAGAVVGALLCLALLNWRAGSDGLLSLELAAPPPPEVEALGGEVLSEALAGVLRLDALEVTAAGESGSIAEVTLTNLTKGTVRELTVQLQGVDARGRPLRTPAQVVPTIVGAQRSVTVEIEVPDGTTVRTVVAQQWTQRTEALSVTELRARERGEAEGTPAAAPPDPMLGLD